MKSLEIILLHMLSVIIQDAEELGGEIKVYHIEPTCWLLCNKEVKKTVAVGLVPDLNDKKRKTIGAMEIKVKNYNWAMTEGFTHKDLIDKDLNVLKAVPLHEVSKVLTSK